MAPLQVLTVSQLTFYIKSLLEGDANLASVIVSGEISNYKNHYSGHRYFTLKDEKATLKCVMFRASAQRLRFEPDNGMKVLVRGRISVYPADGSYQMYAEDIQPEGLGALHLAFEKMKAKLAKEGLFDAEAKKQVPKYPESIGLITAEGSAAYRDVVSVLARRFPYTRVIFAPVQVQGAAAAGSIASALAQFDLLGCADVIIVCRGGGSLEDLWAFNEEIVARAVYACRIPVISGVGHETDFTICDFTADLRAPTPSAAAELAVPSAADEKIRNGMLAVRCSSAVWNYIAAQREKVAAIRESPGLAGPSSLIDTYRQRIDLSILDIERAVRTRLTVEHSLLDILTGKLQSMSPLHVLLRGYSIVQNESGSIITDGSQTQPGGKILVRLAKGSLQCTVDKVGS